MSAPLLEVQNLKLYYPVKVRKNALFSEKGFVKAVDDIDKRNQLLTKKLDKLGDDMPEGYIAEEAAAAIDAPQEEE